MSDKLYVIFDTSGSMYEMCKIDTEEYLRSTLIGLLKRNGSSEAVFFSWSDEMTVLDSLDCLEANGQSDMTRLEGLLNDLPEGSDIMLIGDGHFPDDTDEAKRIIKGRQHRVVSVYVGEDALKHELKSLSLPGAVFPAIEIVAALDRFNGK